MEAAMARAAGQLASHCLRGKDFPQLQGNAASANRGAPEKLGTRTSEPGTSQAGSGYDPSGFAAPGAEIPGAGAAGGITFGLMIAARARLVPGFALVSAWLDIERRVSEADVVITGEGSFDESSYHGKGPGALIDLARRLKRPVHIFAGRISAPPIDGVALNPITPVGMPLAEALATAAPLLSACVEKNLRASPDRLGST
jgi:hypothetical protein